MQRLKVLISGTSSGIGLATAKKFLRYGYEVIGIDVLPASIDYGRYTHIVADVANASELPDIDDIAHLILNAGTVDEARAIDVDLLGYINMGEKYGFQKTLKSIVMVGSISARTGIDYPRYCAAQGGRASYVKNLAIRVAKENKVPCNIISFGAVRTGLEKQLYANPEKMQAVADESLLKKWCYPAEAADWIFFVATKNKSMTGQDILIDNGETTNFHFIEERA